PARCQLDSTPGEKAHPGPGRDESSGGWVPPARTQARRHIRSWQETLPSGSSLPMLTPTLSAHAAGLARWRPQPVLRPQAWPSPTSNGYSPYNPRACARLVKKIPEGFWAGSVATSSSVRVLYTVMRSLSREDTHTSSPRGVNSMCNTDLPGSRVRTTSRVWESITCTTLFFG